MQKAVYSEPCRSGHKNHTVSGRVPVLWPGSTLHYLQTMQEVRADDWDVRYSGNRFSFLGNGISHAEFDSTSDLSYYIRVHDDSPPLTRRKRMELTMRSGSQPARVLHRTHRPTTINLAPMADSKIPDEIALNEGDYSSGEMGIEKIKLASVSSKRIWKRIQQRLSFAYLRQVKRLT